MTAIDDDFFLLSRDSKKASQKIFEMFIEHHFLQVPLANDFCSLVSLSECSTEKKNVKINFLNA